MHHPHPSPSSSLRHGAIFWPDFPVTGDEHWQIKPQAWQILGLPPESNAEIESGQLLIDKQTSWPALMVTLYMNARFDFFYRNCTWGDKDTFSLAWKLWLTPRQAPRSTNLAPRAAGDAPEQIARNEVLPLGLLTELWRRA